MLPSDIIAVVALVVSGVSAWAAISSKVSAERAAQAALAEATNADDMAQKQNDRAARAEKAMFLRQFVIDLFHAWQGTNRIDPNALIGPDVVKAANALDLTSTLWNFEIVDKKILFQNYWEPFKEIYDALYNCKNMVPGQNKDASAFISSQMTRAYSEMRQMEISSVPQGNID